MDSKISTVTRDKEIHHILIKRVNQNKHITILNIYIPYARTPKYIKQIQKIKGTIDSEVSGSRQSYPIFDTPWLWSIRILRPWDFLHSI